MVGPISDEHCHRWLQQSCMLLWLILLDSDVSFVTLHWTCQCRPRYAVR